MTLESGESILEKIYLYHRPGSLPASRVHSQVSGLLVSLRRAALTGKGSSSTIGGK